MTKSLIIEFDAQDESLLLAFFKKLSIKVRNTEGVLQNLDEHTFVQKALTEKYVTTDKWEKMSEEEKEDAALAEMMAYEQQRPDYKVMTEEESDVFFKNLKNKLYADTTD